MFKIIWQIAYPLSVAFFAAAVLNDKHAMLALGLGGILGVVGNISYHLDRKDEERSSYKRVSYAMKRLDGLLTKQRKALVRELSEALNKGGTDE